MVEINLLNIVRIFRSEQLFKGKYHFTDMKHFAERHCFQQTSSVTQELSSCQTSTQPGIMALLRSVSGYCSHSDCLKAGH